MRVRLGRSGPSTERVGLSRDGAAMTNPLFEQAVDAFAATLGRYRVDRGLSKKQLAGRMGFDPSYVSHVEAGRHRPSEDFARRAEAVLHTGGLIWQRFLDYDQVRQAATGSAPRPSRGDSPEPWALSATGPVVEEEQAELSYVEGSYRCTVRRELYNAGSAPVTRYLVRVVVDRYPGEPERSNRYYRDYPLTWAQLDLHARCGDEDMAWRAKLDRDAVKEAWLLFENDGARFPLYPGQRTTITYTFTVGGDKWGNWFQRAVRLPTRRLSVRLDFPTHLYPVVWGVETSMTAETRALGTPVTEGRSQGRTTFAWAIDDPPLNARYRLEWRFRQDASMLAPPRSSDGGRGPGIAATLQRAGILQRGAPVLDRAVHRFDLPQEAALAKDVVARLLDALQAVAGTHEPASGMGLAAPQLGLGWAAAVVTTPSDDDIVDTAGTGGGAGQGVVGPIVLLNPTVVGESMDRDEQYESCLSFFDVRGAVPRPRVVEVEHEDLTGTRMMTTFRHGLARLVAHEIDHLSGLLYTDRMPTGGILVPVDQLVPADPEGDDDGDHHRDAGWFTSGLPPGDP